MSKNYPRRPLVWIDCEMTGLDLEKDALVEVAVVITDEQLRVVDPGIDIIIKPSDEALENMGDFVRDMHTKSGLIDEFENGVSMEEAQRTVLEYVKRFVPLPRRALLAGNSIGTDKQFLERDMPELIDYLHYRVVDVSSIKELAKRWFHRTFEEAPEKHGGHRARADILESIQELEYYRRVLFPKGEGPSRDEARKVAAEVLELGIPNIE
ncbi:MAG: oligoribonuclease [Actinomycetaceae bacterium]|nr:oligoribonuclease [Actinomycetaceae bacterium]